MKKIFNKTLCFGLSALLLLSACKKDVISDLTLAGHQAVDAYQLATAEFGVAQLVHALPDSTLTTSSTITFTSDGAVSGPQGNALFPLPDQSKGHSFALSIAEINSLTTTGFLQTSFNDTLTFALPQQALIKNIKFRAGQLRIKYSTNCKHNNAFTVSIPLLKQGGVAFTEQANVNYAGMLPVESEVVTDLAGYSINLAFNGATPSNRLSFMVKDSISYIGNSLQIDDSTFITVQFVGLEFSNIDGNFGSMMLPAMQSTFPVEFFNNITAGGLRFKAPSLNLTMSNSMGMPLTGYIDQVAGQSPITGTTILHADTLLTGWNYAVPTLKGKTALRTIKLTGAISDLPELLYHAPTSMLLNLRDSVRQLPTTYSYFLTDTSSASIYSELLMPLEGAFDSITMLDTVALNMSVFKDKTIKALRLYVTNSFPVSATIQIWPLDAAGIRGAALLSDDGFAAPAGTVKSSGAISAPSVIAQTIAISNTQYQALLHADRVVCAVKLVTAASTTVKIGSASKIKFNIGVQADR